MCLLVQYAFLFSKPHNTHYVVGVSCEFVNVNRGRGCLRISKVVCRYERRRIVEESK